MNTEQLSQPIPRRNRGAQPGNQNARKHGFYSKSLDNTERGEMDDARKMWGLDEEIALLRVRIKTLMKEEPHNTRVIGQYVKILASLVSTRHSTSKGDPYDFAERIRNYFEAVGFKYPAYLPPRREQPIPTPPPVPPTSPPPASGIEGAVGASSGLVSQRSIGENPQPNENGSSVP